MESVRRGGVRRRQLITPTERRVLELVATGQTNREIAEKLYISYHTVSAHRSRLMRKLGLDSPNGLRRFAEGFLRLKRRKA